MKPVAFDYVRPRSVAAAIDLLDQNPGAKIMAGAQTLGPMLNLRLVQPQMLIDITRIPQLLRAEKSNDGLVIGACVSHAAIEDGRTPDVTNGFLRKIAHGIAYRAVRTRGTIGGSLAHGDPAADWLSALMVLGGAVEIESNQGRRKLALSSFVQGAMQTDLHDGELLTGIHITACGPKALFGFHKICRKTGEFADAIGAASLDGPAGEFIMVAGAGSGRPIQFTDPAKLLRGGDPRDAGTFDIDMAMGALQDAGHGGDAYELQINAVAMRRALVAAVRQ